MVRAPPKEQKKEPKKPVKDREYKKQEWVMRNQEKAVEKRIESRVEKEDMSLEYREDQDRVKLSVQKGAGSKKKKKTMVVECREREEEEKKEEQYPQLPEKDRINKGMNDRTWNEIRQNKIE